MNFVHQNLSEGRWFEMSLAEQLGNVGSEVERAIRWRKKGDSEQSQKAFDRMLELLDLTLNDRRWRGARLRELARLREELCRILTDDDEDTSGIQNYFLYFGILARANK